ncbi:MAG TPA: efflux RND transporter permease subunit [Spirochaetota bacterium]|nr:efflux RND transporter permease subunit [Spirochaetota bacterium]
MKKWFNIVLTYPKTVIVIIIVITVLLGSGVFKIQFDSSLDAVMPRHDPEYLLNEEVKKTYGNTGKFIIIDVASSDMLQPHILTLVSNLHDDIDEYRRFDEGREMHRLSLLQELSHNKNITKQMLLQTFADDPVFTRYIMQTLQQLDIEGDRLSQRDMTKIIKKFTRTIEVKRNETVDLIISPFTMKDLRGQNDTLYVRDIVEKDETGKRKVPQTAEEIAEFKKRLTNNPAFEKGIYVKDAQGTITDFGILLRLVDQPQYDPLVKEILDIISYYQGAADIVIQGVPVTHHEINEYMKRDLERFIPLVLLAVLIVFYLNFRSVRGMLLPFATLVFADLWVIGLMGHLGFKLNVIGVALPPLMTAVGSSYSIHILNRYYIDYPAISRLGKYKGIMSSSMHISLTVILAALTTALGFFTLITNQVSSIREMGVFAAIGVIFSVIIALSMIPAVLMLLPHKEKKLQFSSKVFAYLSNLSTVDTIVTTLAHWAVKKTPVVMSILFILICIAFFGLSKVNVESSVHAYFKEGDYILVSSKIIGQKFGGSTGLNILIETNKHDGIKNPQFLQFVDTFRDWLVADENIDLNIGRTDAFTDFIKTINLAMHDNDFAYYCIPDTEKDIDSYIDLYGGKDDNDNGLADEFEPYVDRKFTTVNIFARIWEKEGKLLTSSIMHHTINKIGTYLDTHLPDGYTYKITGEPKVLVRMSEYIVRGQIMSLALSLISIFVVVFMLFNNIRAALVALIPISTAVLLNFGVMGFLGIRLDIATAIIASITIGIGIDDTIHFLNTYRHFDKMNIPQDEVILKTLHQSGKAIVYTSIALIFGFLVLVISSFKPVIYFAVLLAVTMITTTIGALLFLPATIYFFKLNLSPKISTSKVGQILNIGKYFELESD